MRGVEQRIQILSKFVDVDRLSHSNDIGLGSMLSDVQEGLTQRCAAHDERVHRAVCLISRDNEILPQGPAPKVIIGDDRRESSPPGKSGCLIIILGNNQFSARQMRTHDSLKEASHSGLIFHIQDRNTLWLSANCWDNRLFYWRIKAQPGPERIPQFSEISCKNIGDGNLFFSKTLVLLACPAAVSGILNKRWEGCLGISGPLVGSLEGMLAIRKQSSAIWTFEEQSRYNEIIEMRRIRAHMPMQFSERRRLVHFSIRMLLLKDSRNKINEDRFPVRDKHAPYGRVAHRVIKTRF